MGRDKSAASGDAARSEDHVVQPNPSAARSTDPVLPDVTSDESDTWGERVDDADDLERFNRERPPHHL